MKNTLSIILSNLLCGLSMKVNAGQRGSDKKINHLVSQDQVLASVLFFTILQE